MFFLWSIKRYALRTQTNYFCFTFGVSWSENKLGKHVFIRKARGIVLVLAVQLAQLGGDYRLTSSMFDSILYIYYIYHSGYGFTSDDNIDDVSSDWATRAPTVHSERVRDAYVYMVNKCVRQFLNFRFHRREVE